MGVKMNSPIVMLWTCYLSPCSSTLQLLYSYFFHQKSSRAACHLGGCQLNPSHICWAYTLLLTNSKKTSYLMAGSSAPFINKCNSENRGSALVWILMRKLIAVAAFIRTCLLESFNALRKVVWSCGRNCLSIISTLASRRASVSSTAALTVQLNLKW